VNTKRIRIFLLGTSIAIGTVAGLAPTAGAIDIVRAPREGIDQPVIRPGIDPCSLVDCDGGGPVIENPNLDPCDLVDCDKPVIDNPRIDPCDLVPEACSPGTPGKPGTPSTNPDAPVKADVAFTG